MARQGLSYEQVAAVADALVAEQIKPTLSGLRERLGSGSMNTIHRHLTAWQTKQKPAARKLSEPNSRLLAALGAELSKVADEASAEAHAELQNALNEVAVMATNGEALEAEREDLSRQLAEAASERDTLAGRANEQAAEIERLKDEAKRQHEELTLVRRMLAQAELRLEAVPRLEQELAVLRNQVTDEQSRRTAAEQGAAVAEAIRQAAEAARERAEARLESAEAREAETRKELATSHAAHESTRDKLIEAASQAAGAAAELKEVRAQIEASATVAAAADSNRPGSDEAK